MLLSLLLFLLALAFHYFLPEPSPNSIRADSLSSNLEIEQKLQEALGRGVFFEALGVDQPGHFIGQAEGYRLRLTPQGVSLSSRTGQQVQMRFLAAEERLLSGQCPRRRR